MDFVMIYRYLPPFTMICHFKLQRYLIEIVDFTVLVKSCRHMMTMHFYTFTSTFWKRARKRSRKICSVNCEPLEAPLKKHVFLSSHIGLVILTFENTPHLWSFLYLLAFSLGSTKFVKYLDLKWMDNSFGTSFIKMQITYIFCVYYTYL